MTDLTDDQVRALLDGVAQNPPRVCMAWCGKAKDDCDCNKAVVAVNALNDAASDLARALLDARAERDRVAAINVKHCEAVNTLLVDGARLEDRAKAAEAERDRLRDRERVLADFIAEFAAAKIDALRYQPAYGESPEDAPDPVVEAETVWAWQADAKAALATLEAGNG